VGKVLVGVDGHTVVAPGLREVQGRCLAEPFWSCRWRSNRFSLFSSDRHSSSTR
jgi:hypothetical protein